jgi:hyperosmotically inducible periplasmic protein
MHSKVLFGSAVFAGILLLSVPSIGAAADSATGNAKTEVNDSWLTAKTKVALFKDDRVKSSRISVDTEQGVVTLRGQVGSADAKEAATEVARGVQGVKDVRNELQIAPPSARQGGGSR